MVKVPIKASKRKGDILLGCSSRDAEFEKTTEGVLELARITPDIITRAREVIDTSDLDLVERDPMKKPSEHDGEVEIEVGVAYFDPETEDIRVEAH